MINKKLGISLSEAYLGYIGDSIVRPLDDNIEDDTVYMVCKTKRYQIDKLNRPKWVLTGDKMSYDNRLFEFFPGFVSKKHHGHKIFSGNTFWETLGASSIGDDYVWCVNDSTDDRIYLVHSWKSTLYHLGRVHKGHQLEKACHWRYKRIKI